MTLLLMFFALAFFAGLRSRSDFSALHRWMILGMCLFVSVALLSHRVA